MRALNYIHCEKYEMRIEKIVARPLQSMKSTRLVEDDKRRIHKGIK